MNNIIKIINIELFNKTKELTRIMHSLVSFLPSSCIAVCKDCFFITPIKQKSLTIIADDENIAYRLRHYQKEIKNIMLTYHNIRIDKVIVKVKNKT
jgi:hypothetical protein